MLNRLTYELTTTIDLRMFLMNLALAGILGILLTIYYLNFRTERFGSLKYVKVILPLVLIMTLTTAVVSSSVSLALGLLGTLSIIRFRVRTPNVEPILYLLLAIGSGVGIGKGMYAITFIGIGSILFIIWGARKLMTPRKALLNIAVSFPLSRGKPFATHIQQEFPSLTFRAFNAQGENEEWVFQAKVEKAGDIQQLKEKIRELRSNAHISISYDPE